MSSIEQGIWREILTHINEATVNGLLDASSVPSHNEAFLSALRHSNEVFAAFKVHALQQEVAAKLLTPDGHLKSFADFRRDVEPITSHQCGTWLRTEYDTAVIRAHNAADWQSFQHNKDVMPNLRWCPTTAPEPEAAHRAFWLAKLNLPVDDPFWQHHHPGDHWNCKCSLEQNADPVVRPTDIPKYDQPDKGLDNNPGKDGHTFSDNHPYFPDKCSHCFAYKKNGTKNILKATFRNARTKDCYNCPYIDNCLSGRRKVRRQRVEQHQAAAHIRAFKAEIDMYNGRSLHDDNFITGKLTILRRSLQDVYEHNREDSILMRWLKNFDFTSIEGWKYKGWAENRPYAPESPHYDPRDPLKMKHPETEYFLYYSFKISGKIYWANVKMHRSYGEVLYTIEKEKPEDLIPGPKE